MDDVQNYLSAMEPEARSRSYTWHGPRKPEQLMIRVTDDLKDEVFDCSGGSGSLELGSGSEGWTEGGLIEGKMEANKDDMNMKKPNSRRNAWGCMSYADLIARAIESVPERRLTLSQIYDWMIQNVPYFRDKGESSSSAGWKNSIRHNLSLHRRFTRVQNEGTGKSSWWIINEEANTPITKSSRRRAITMDTQAFEKKRPRLTKKPAADKVSVKNGLPSGDQYNGRDVLPGVGEMFMEDGTGYQIANTLARHSSSSDGSPFFWPGMGEGMPEGGRFVTNDGAFPDGLYVGYTGLYQTATPDMSSVTFSGSPEDVKPFYETSYSTQLTPLHNLKYLDCQTTVAGGIDMNANDTLPLHTTPLPPASILLPLSSPSRAHPNQQNVYRYDGLQSPRDMLNDGNFQVENPTYQAFGYSDVGNSPQRFPTIAELSAAQLKAAQPMTTNIGLTKGSVLRQMLSQGPMMTGGIFSSNSPTVSVESKYSPETTGVDVAPGYSTSGSVSESDGCGQYRQYVKLEKMTSIPECGEERRSNSVSEGGYHPSVTGSGTVDTISGEFGTGIPGLATNCNVYRYDFNSSSFTSDYNCHIEGVRNAVIGYDHASAIDLPTTMGYSADVYASRLEPSASVGSNRLCSDVMKTSTCKTTLNQAVAVESTDQSTGLEEIEYVSTTQNNDSAPTCVGKDSYVCKTEAMSDDECTMGRQMLKEVEHQDQPIKEEDCPPSSGVADENWEFNFDLVPNSSTMTSVASPVTAVATTACETVTDACAAEVRSALKLTVGGVESVTTAASVTPASVTPAASDSIAAVS